jgi:DUF971 family protein
MKPIDIRAVGEDELLISWEDGHRSLYKNDYLRLNCPCAGCRDEWSGKRLITLNKIPANISPLATSPVGNYAIRIKWSDRHETGIYGFEFLKSICPCAICQKQKG